MRECKIVVRALAKHKTLKLREKRQRIDTDMMQVACCEGSIRKLHVQSGRLCT